MTNKDKIHFIDFVIYLLALVIILPMGVIGFSVFLPYSGNFYHVISTTLGEYIINSYILIAGVGLLSFIFGTLSAWLVTIYDFPGKKVFGYLLLFPLAFPAYIAAYTYAGMFEYAGPLQSYLREIFSWQHGDYYFPQIRSIGGAIFVMSIVFYPYVYLLARAAFAKSYDAVQIGRSLGKSGVNLFFKVAVPAARPAIIASLALVLMETLADYGAVDYFAVDSFTTGIYRAWFGMGDYVVAAKLAFILMSFVAVLMFIEAKSRKSKANYNSFNQSFSKIQPIKLKSINASLACAFCALLIFFGFMLPFTRILWQSLQRFDAIFDVSFLNMLANTILIAVIAAMCATIISLIFAYALKNKTPYRLTIKAASFGYAIPGSVAAVGILVLFGKIDDYIGQLFLTGSIFALIFAYIFRFQALSLNSIESGFAKIGPEIDQAVKLYNNGKATKSLGAYMGMLDHSIIYAFLLVFVESVKELPATLIIRPFDFETLATYTYQLASDERLRDASVPSLFIIMASIVPIILISKNYNKS